MIDFGVGGGEFDENRRSIADGGRLENDSLLYKGRRGILKW